MIDDKTARILELEELLRARNASIRRAADRDAAWSRAIEAWWNKGRWASDSKDFLAAIREILEAEGNER